METQLKWECQQGQACVCMGPICMHVRVDTHVDMQTQASPSQPRSFHSATLPRKLTQGNNYPCHMGILQASRAALSPQAGFAIPMKSFLAPGFNSCPFLSPIQSASRFWMHPGSVLTAQVLESA